MPFDAASPASPVATRPGVPPLKRIAWAGLGSFLAIGACGLLSEWSGLAWLMAPFGASCVLVFGLPESPLAQPRHVIGGHLIASMIGLILAGLLPATPLALAASMALALVAMQLTRTVHPPAGADPLVFMMAGQGLAEAWPQLLHPVLAGSALIVLIGIGVNWLAGRRPYPLYWV